MDTVKIQGNVICMKSKRKTVGNKEAEKVLPVSKPSYSKWTVKNVIAVGIVLLLLKAGMILQPTYEWICFTMLPENMAIVRAYPNLNYDGRMTIKLGANYTYLKNTREHTPEDAVILWPSSSAFTKEKSPFTAEVSNKIYALRFLYPRKLVIPFDFGKSHYAKEITHVAIVNGEGFEYVPYEVEKFENGILPVEKLKK